MLDSRINYTQLDGSLDEEKKCGDNFIKTITEEEHKRAMSSEFDYLEED